MSQRDVTALSGREYRACADDGDLPYSNEDTSPDYGTWRATEVEARRDAEQFANELPAYERIWIQRRAAAGPPIFHVLANESSVNRP